MATVSGITPCLWFDTEAEPAARFYVSVFRNGRIGEISHFGKEGFEIHRRPEGLVMTVEFEIAGQRFTALNGGPEFTFNQAISFQVPCATQGEIDHYWHALGEGGAPGQCGWLKDRFGVSWQVFPAALPAMMRDPDRRKADRVMRALLGMAKIDLARLQAAYEGE
jgi:predicted 3-demethylubiquinone-9 3-methyltransferase (glyoxalase superfamily)